MTAIDRTQRGGTGSVLTRPDRSSHDELDRWYSATDAPMPSPAARVTLALVFVVPTVAAVLIAFSVLASRQGADARVAAVAFLAFLGWCALCIVPGVLGPPE